MFSTFVGFFAHLFFSFWILICKKMLFALSAVMHLMFSSVLWHELCETEGQNCWSSLLCAQVEVGDSAAAVWVTAASASHHPLSKGVRKGMWRLLKTHNLNGKTPGCQSLKKKKKENRQAKYSIATSVLFADAADSGGTKSGFFFFHLREANALVLRQSKPN